MTFLYHENKDDFHLQEISKPGRMFLAFHGPPGALGSVSLSSREDGMPEEQPGCSSLEQGRQRGSHLIRVVGLAGFY